MPSSSPTGSSAGTTSATALADYETSRRPRAEAVLKMSRCADKAAQLASPLGCRLRNAFVRWLPERAQRRQSSCSSTTSSDRKLKRSAGRVLRLT